MRAPPVGGVETSLRGPPAARRSRLRGASEVTFSFDVSRLLLGCGRAVIGGAVLLLALGSGGVAYAQSAEPTPSELRAAAEAFDRGREAYKEEKFAEAAEQFERADASAPNATALSLAIKARDKAGDLDRAGTLAALSLERYPDDPEIQKIAPEVLSRAGAEMHELHISCAEPCELADGTKIVHGAAAKLRTVFLAEGSHSIRAGFVDGRTQSKTVEATPGGSGQLSFEGAEPEPEKPPPDTEPKPFLVPVDEPSKDEPRTSGGLPPAVFFAGLGATAVAGGITIWSGLDAVKNPGVDRVKAECAAGDTNCPLYKDGQARQLRTNILIGVTAVLGVGTGVLGAIGIDWGGGSAEKSETEAKARGLRVEPWVAIGDGAAVGARGSF
jgi:hypothetical protein